MRRFLLILLLVGIACRGLIPSGWMPTGEKAFAIAICNGVETHSVWLDSKGQLHKQDPSKKPVADPEPCAFGGLPLAAKLEQFPVIDIAPAQHHVAPVRRADAVSIGSGLAAPPPPATGPPVLI